MVIDPQYEAQLIEALDHLRDAKSLVDQISREIGDDCGKHERLVCEALQSGGKRISSARRELQQLVPRRSYWTLEDDPFRPKMRLGPRSDAANSDGPPEPPPPPPED